MEYEYKVKKTVSATVIVPIKRHVSQKLFVFCIYDGNNRNYAAKTKIN